jgi:hypothetical protein
MVKYVRDSAAHAEDRARSRKRRQPIPVKGLLGLSNLEGDRLSYTIEDGSYQEFGVNDETLSVLVETINKLLQVLPWKGTPHVEPS